MGANVGVVRFRSRGLLVLWFGCGLPVVWLLLFLWVGFYDRPRRPTKVTQKKTEKNTKAGALIPDILSTYISILIQIQRVPTSRGEI